MTTSSKARVYRRDPRPLRRGACPTCFREVAITSRGRRRQHKDAEGGNCTGGGIPVGDPSVTAEAVTMGLLIASVLPERSQMSRQERAATPPAERPVATRREGGRGTTLPSTGLCHTCGKRVSGERRYCGPCLAARKP